MKMWNFKVMWVLETWLLYNRDMRLRFLEAFQKQGEANAVVDRQLLMSSEYAQLLLRLHEAARVSSRDHWCAAPFIGPHAIICI